MIIMLSGGDGGGTEIEVDEPWDLGTTKEILYFGWYRLTSESLASYAGETDPDI